MVSILRRTSWYFLSSIGTPLLGLITLPIFTTKLGLEHFGVFALGSALAGVVSATSGSVSTVSLPLELGQRSQAERGPFLTAVLLLSLAVGFGTCVAVFGLYCLAKKIFSLEWLTPLAITLAICAALLNSLWAVCTEILTIDGRAKLYAVTNIVQVLGSACIVTVALFIFDDLENALFWGFLSAAVVGAVATVYALRHWLDMRTVLPWISSAGRGGVAAVIASLTETGKVALERIYIGAFLGVSPLGMLAHAQYYKNVSMIALNALSRGVWPTALSEGREPQPTFFQTLQMWKYVQQFVAMLTVGFALLGREIIGILTHGKFVDATPYAVALLLVLLVQTAAKPHLAILSARGQGHIIANLNTVSVVIGFVWLLISTPFFGLWGAVSAVMMQAVIHRVAVFAYARLMYRLPFTDFWIVAGFTATTICSLFSAVLMPSVYMRLGLCLVIFAATLWKVGPAILRARRSSVHRESSELIP